MRIIGSYAAVLGRSAIRFSNASSVKSSSLFFNNDDTTTTTTTINNNYYYSGIRQSRLMASSSTNVELLTCELTDKYMTEPLDIVTNNNDHNNTNSGVQVVAPPPPHVFRDYGGKIRFSGIVSTVECYENNPLVREALTKPPPPLSNDIAPDVGRVLVVDGGMSYRCALLGDFLAHSGAVNGWSGIIINGCVRDSHALKQLDIGVKALGTHPRKSSKRDKGIQGSAIVLHGVIIREGDYIYCDEDGILVSPKPLTLP